MANSPENPIWEAIDINKHKAINALKVLTINSLGGPNTPAAWALDQELKDLQNSPKDLVKMLFRTLLGTSEQNSNGDPLDVVAQAITLAQISPEDINSIFDSSTT